MYQWQNLSFIHHFPVSLLFFVSILLFLLGSSVWRWWWTSGGPCGTAAGNSGVHNGRKRWSHDPAGHWPRFRHCCTSAILRSDACAVAHDDRHDVGSYRSHHAGQGWVIDSLPVVAKQQNRTEQWSGHSGHHYSHFEAFIINHFNHL